MLHVVNSVLWSVGDSDGDDGYDDDDDDGYGDVMWMMIFNNKLYMDIKVVIVKSLKKKKGPKTTTEKSKPCQ